MGFVDSGWHRLPRHWAVGGLLGANLAPLVGVVALGWSAGQLLVFYWLENGVIGAANVPKILLSSRHQADGDPAGRDAGISFVFFYGFHYGMFWIGHGVFVAVLLLTAAGAGLGFSTLFGPGLLLAVGTVVVSQAVEYRTDFLRDGQYRRRSPKEQMKEPYGRVMVLHVVILAGAYPIMGWGSPLPALVLLVGLKFVLDLVGYWRQLDSRE